MPKIINLSGTFNTRDIGGLTTTSGKKVKYGMMYRSDALDQLTPQDIEQLEALNIKTIVDFRGADEIAAAPDKKIPNTVTVNLAPQAAVAALASGNIVDDQQKIDALLKEAATEAGRANLKIRVDEMAEQMKDLVSEPHAISQYKKFIQLLLHPSNLPILHHCKGGKDRTGFAAMITLFILDVPLETVREEYLLTKKSMEQRNEKRMEEYRQYTDNEIVLDYLFGLMQTKELYFQAAIDTMNTMSGSIDQYLEEVLAVTPRNKAVIQQLFLEN